MARDNLARKGVYDDEPERPGLRLVRPGDTASDFEPPDTDEFGDESPEEIESGSSQPDLQSIDGGGDSSARSRDHLKSVPTGDDLKNAEDDTDARSSGIEDKNAKKEKDAAVGKEYDGAATDDSRKSLKKTLLEGNTLKRALLGGGIFAGGSGLVMSFFIIIAPLKMIHIVSNLQHKFFANAEQATQKETDRLFTSYLSKYVMPGMAGSGVCHSTATISKDCVHVAPGDGPVSKLMNGWRDGRLENKLSKNFGTEFIKKPDGTFWMKSKVLTGDGINVSDLNGNKVAFLTDSNGFKNLGRGPRTAYRAALADLRKSMDGETKWKQVMYRIKVGRLLQEKYGFRRCIFFCSTRDAFDKAWSSKVVNPSKLWAAATVNKVILPQDEVLNVAFACVLDPDCQPTKSRTTAKDCVPGVDCALGGEPLSATESDAQKAFTELASKLDTQAAADLVKTAADIEAKGYAQVLFERLFAGVGSKAFSTISTKVIPIIGWIDLGAQIVNVASSVPDAWKAMGYMVTSVAAVNTFSMYRVMADEQKFGNTSNSAIGSMTTHLGQTNTKDQGGVAAEAHPLYKELIDGGYGTAASSSSTYKCDDGGRVPFGKYICPEESLAFDNSVLDALKAFFDGPGIVLKGIAKVWSSTIGLIFKAVGWILGKGIEAVNSLCDSGVPAAILAVVPGLYEYCGARSAALKYGKEFMQMVISYIFRVPMTLTSSGGRVFSTLATGADVLGKNSAEYTTGGMALSATQAAALIQEENQQDADQYATLPLSQRLFSTSESKSLISRVALAMPTNISAAVLGNSLSSLANPLSMLMGGFNTLLSAQSASAQSSTAGTYVDYFGDGASIGVPVDDASYTPDQQDVWDNPDPGHVHGSNLKCVDGSFTEKWNNDAIDNTDKSPVGQPVHTYTNPCLRIQNTATAAGAVFTTNVLTDDDKGVDPNAATATPPGGGAPGPAASCGDEIACAKAILADPHVHYLFPNTRSDFEAAAAGRTVDSPGCPSTHLQPAMMAVILAVTQKYEIGLTAIVSDHHCNGGAHPGR